MTRGEKIVASVLGLLVFLGLFFFIYSSMNAAPTYPAYDEGVADYGDDFGYDVETDTAPVADLTDEEAAPATERKPFGK